MSAAGAPANLLAAWCRLLIDSLAEAGVRDVVLSPGSRSTPLVLALASAARRGLLACHDVIDERAAGFHALGMARAGGRPVALVCTSGTAGAHYLPAVIEAGLASVPLLVLTADRPFELMDCAAPQTIDQTRLFGDHARAYLDLGHPDDAEGALRALRRRAAQAVERTRHPVPGPVHMNVRARKPLEPPRDEAMGDAERALSSRVDALLARPLVRAFAPRLLPDEGAIEALATAVVGARAGVIVAGPAALAQAAVREELFALGRATGFVLLAEAASQLRFAAGRAGVAACDRYETLLAAPAFRMAMAPDLVLQIGAPPTSSAVETWLEAHPSCARWVVAPHGWNDPSSRATALLRAEVGPAARALAARLGELRGGVAPGSGGDGFGARFAAADALAAATIDRFVDERPLGEAAAVRAVVAACAAAPGQAPPVLTLGNSLPIRTVDLACAGTGFDLPIASQRGANGIDGLIAGAAGVARTGRPSVLLLGDVSAVHDLGGLGAARGLPAPLAVVVLDNGGGRIFDTLPVAARTDLADAMHHFTTAPEVDFAHAAAAFGHRFAAPEGAPALAAAVGSALRFAGCTLVAVRLPHAPADELRALRADVERALAGRPELLVASR